MVFRSEMKKNCIEIRILQENYLPARQVFRYIFAIAKTLKNDVIFLYRTNANYMVYGPFFQTMVLG